jgi:cytochrome c oxidase subunit 3
MNANHDYHLVDPSPWPVLCAVAAFVLALGGILSMHGYPLWLFAAGALGLALTMFFWWRDVIAEAIQGDHTPVVQFHLRYGMLLFIVSEIMFFVAWFWAYFNISIFPADSVMEARSALFDYMWPPKGIETLNAWDIPFLNTVVLLLSGTTVTWAHNSLMENNRKGFVQGLFLTVVLGLFFTALQVYEYLQASFSFAGHVYGAAFYMATGFHGAHVIIGTIFLIVCLFRAIKGHFTPTQHFGFEAAAWYWHFVDVVWLFLFFSIYVWGG